MDTPTSTAGLLAAWQKARAEKDAHPCDDTAADEQTAWDALRDAEDLEDVAREQAGQ